MVLINKYGTAGLKVVLVVTCIAMAILVPRWRDILRAQDYIHPKITSIDPTTASPGTVVTIEGSDLTSYVTFQQKDSPFSFAEAEIVSWSTTEVLAVVPDLPPGSYYISVCADYCDQIDFEITGCDPPNPDLVSVDNRGAHGLFEGILTESHINEKTLASFTIMPTDVFFDIFTFSRRGIAIWFSIIDIDFDHSKVTVEPDMTGDIIGEEAARSRIIPPNGHANFIAEFCRPSNITFKIAIDDKAATFTIADLIAPISTIADFTLGLLDIPLFNSAVTHYVEAWQITPGNSVITEFREAAQEIALAARDLTRLAVNREQRDQLIQVFSELGINVAIADVLKGAADLIRISTDLNTFLLATGGTFETASDIIVTAPK